MDGRALVGRRSVELVNPESLTIVRGAKIEPSVAGDPLGSRYQFERMAYFISDPLESKRGRSCSTGR